MTTLQSVGMKTAEVAVYFVLRIVCSLTGPFHTLQNSRTAVLQSVGPEITVIISENSQFGCIFYM